MGDTITTHGALVATAGGSGVFFSTTWAGSSLLGVLPHWRAWMLEQGRSGLAVLKCVRSAEAFLEFASTHAPVPMKVATLTREIAAAWVASLIDPSRPGSAKTAQNGASALRSLTAYLVVHGLLVADPLAGWSVTGPLSARPREPFTDDEVAHLIAAAESRESSDDGRSTRYASLSSSFYSFLHLTRLGFAGTRRQLWADVDLLGRRLVRSCEGPGASSLVLTDEHVTMLARWRQYSGGALVFARCPSHHTLLADMEAAKVPGWEAGADKSATGLWDRFRIQPKVEAAPIDGPCLFAAVG